MRTRAVAILALILVPGSVVARTTMESARYRLGGDSAWTSVRPVTRAGLQAALDKAVPTRRLELQLGPGNLDADSTIWVHGNTVLRGAGHGITTVSRSRYSEHDPIGAGNVVVSSPYGRHSMNSNLSHGIPTDSLESIVIAGLTIDGNCARWPGVNPNRPQNFGINLFYVDAPRLEDVEVKNTLQTGIQFYGCRDGSMTHIWTRDTGKELMLGTRNGINLNDNGASHLPKRWGERFELADIHIHNQKDTAFGFANVSHVKVDSVRIECDHDTTYGNYAFEFEGNTPGYMMRDFRISNVEATGLANQFMTNGIHEGDGLEAATFDHCVSIFSAKAHRGGALNLKGSRPNHLIDCSVMNSSFSNINSSNGDGKIASAAMVYCFNDGHEDCHGLRLQRCRFVGASSRSHHPWNHGIRFGGEFRNVVFDSVTVEGAEAEGFLIAAGKDSLRDVTLTNCVVDGAQSAGFSIVANTPPGAIEGIRLQGCTAKDTNRSGPGSSFEVIGRAGGAVRNVRIEGCRVVRTAGSTMGGFRAVQEGGGEVDSITVRDSDFSQAVGQSYSASGKVTHLVMPSPK